MPTMTLEQWLSRAAATLDLDDLDVSGPAVQTLLDLARDAAHGVARVAAPLTTFLAGVAVGRGLSLEEATARITAALPEEPAENSSAPGD